MSHLNQVALGASQSGPGSLIALARNDVDEWVAASGDHNPIHLDSEFAARHGYTRNFAHGLLCVLLLQDRFDGCIAHILEAGQCYLDYRFRKPVYLGDPFSLSLQWRGEDRFQAEIRDEATDEIKLYMSATGTIPHGILPAELRSGGVLRGLPDAQLSLAGPVRRATSALNRLQILATRTYFDLFDPFLTNKIGGSPVALEGQEVLHLRHQLAVFDRATIDGLTASQCELNVAVWWDEPTGNGKHVFAAANTIIRRSGVMIIASKMSFRVSTQDA